MIYTRAHVAVVALLVGLLLGLVLAFAVGNQEDDPTAPHCLTYRVEQV